MLKKSLYILLTVLMTTILFSGCAKIDGAAPAAAAAKAGENIGCENVQSKVFDALYEYVNTTESLPMMSDLKSELEAVVEKNLVQTQNVKDQKSISAFKSVFIDYMATLIDSVSQKDKLTKEELLQALIEFELQDQSSEEQISMNNNIQNKLAAVKAQSVALNLSCPTTPT